MAEGFSIVCPSCGNAYPWSAQLAGKKGRCKCGSIMRIPSDPPGSANGSGSGAPLPGSSSGASGSAMAIAASGSSHATKSPAVMSRPMPKPMPVANHGSPGDSSIDTAPVEAEPVAATEDAAKAQETPKKKWAFWRGSKKA